MESKELIAFLFLCLLPGGCSVSHGASAAQGTQSVAAGGESSGHTPSAEVEDQYLLSRIEKEQGILKPFAWESWDKKQTGGTVIGIDREGKLKRVVFTRKDGDFVIEATSYIHPMNAPIATSGDLDLEPYLSDKEFPFKSAIISKGDCVVHFVLFWQALIRSFKYPHGFMEDIGLKIIVEQNGKVVSTDSKDLIYDILDDVLVEDVNKDGNEDLLVTGAKRVPFMYIWTVGQDCTVKPLLFKDDTVLVESVGGEDMFLRVNKATGMREVHIKTFDYVSNKDDPNGLYQEITEKVYGWDPAETVYKVVKTTSKLRFVQKRANN